MRLPPRFLRRPSGFTLIELLTVMAVIAILAGLIISISGFSSHKAAMSRAQTEIQALSVACESFKTDNGAYPHQPVTQAITGTVQTSGSIPSDGLDPRTNGNSTSASTGAYVNASLELYEALTGDVTLTGSGSVSGTRNYIPDLRQDSLGRAQSSTAISKTNPITYLSDPFGNCYGYSTANATSVATGTSTVSNPSYPTASAKLPGYNPTFDLWSTGGSLNTPYSGNGASAPGAPGDPALGWAKNW
jgi:prepilin-type N-terminal cleavage/methylation domain-containing protein